MSESNLIDLAERQKDREQNITALPCWAFYDDKNNVKINTPKLAYEVMNEVPLFRSKAIPNGARFDLSTGRWILDDLDDFLDSYITNKLESVGKWSQQKLNDVKKFISIKSYRKGKITNPFDNSDPSLANFINGTYNIKSDEMKAHDEEDYILQTHGFEIDNETENIPSLTIAMMNDLTGDEESTLYLLEAIGYCFYRSYKPFQNITILQGAGGNGKSTFLNLLSDLIGQENISNVSLQALSDKNNRFASSNLYQKNVNVFADVGSEFMTSTSLLKALTGGDWITAEKKGKDGFSFVNFSKLFFSGNELPTFNDFTTGFERRLFVVPFHREIDEAFKKKHDLEAIKREVPLLAIYSMRAFNEALKRGYLTESEKMKQAKDNWIRESNHILQFIEEMCEVDMESDDGDSSKAIYEAYREFCWRENLREYSQPKFTRQLEKMGIYKKNTRQNGTRIWRYIHLKLKNYYIE